MFRFLFGTDPDPGPPRPHPKPRMLVESYNEVGEVVLLDVPKPIKNGSRPKSALYAFQSQTFLNYDSESDQK
jgi:hypothetical protein